VQLRPLGSEHILYPAEEAAEQSERRMPCQVLQHEYEGAVDHHPYLLASTGHLRLPSYTDA